RVAGEGDRVRVVDERRADHVLVGQVRQPDRGRGVGPAFGAGGLVQRLHQGGQRRVPVLAELHRVLDLLQGDDVRVQGVDRRDDLVLLALQVGLVPGATGVAAAADRDRVAVPVGVGGAAGQV